MSSIARMGRERLTVLRMVELRCRLLHHSSQGTLCPECTSLMAYVDQRLEKCPLRDDKPTCLKCPVHCYSPARREEIRNVMRFSGPRMLLRHPLLTFFHVWDARKEPKARPTAPGKTYIGED